MCFEGKTRVARHHNGFVVFISLK